MGGALDHVMQTRLLAALVGATLTATSCATPSGSGAAVGAAGGGLIGAAFGGGTGLLVGAAVGGLLGYATGKEMEEQDRRRMAYAIEADRAARWRNESTGFEYTVEPRRTVVENGQRCREFDLVTDKSGDQERVRGTACQQPDGTWMLTHG
jgi:surface antigen